jgi:hypothetical protein
MKRGPVVYGVLLIAALLFAYQTWTREEVVTPLAGDVVVWSMRPEQIQAITLEAETRSIRVERRSDAKGPYLWGSDTRRDQPYRRVEKDASAPQRRAMRPPHTREFMLSEKGDALFENMAELRALRALGKIDEDKRQLYDLHEETETITVIYDGGSRSLVVGGKIYSGSDRYALDPSTGEGYVISQKVIRDLTNGESGLRLTRTHDFKDEEVGKVVVEVKGQKRTLLSITAKDAMGRESRTWADAQQPDKPDQTMSNFLNNIDALRPVNFVTGVDVAGLELVMRVEYQTRVGAPLGWLELYRQPAPAGDATGGAPAPGQQAAPGAAPGAPGQQAAPGAAPGAPGQQAAPGAAPGAPGQQAAPGQATRPNQPRQPIYLMRTELARVLAAVSRNAVTRITEDIDQIFGQ